MNKIGWGHPEKVLALVVFGSRIEKRRGPKNKKGGIEDSSEEDWWRLPCEADWRRVAIQIELQDKSSNV